MPKSSAVKGSALFVAHWHSSKFEQGIAWGCLAGAGLGFGIILNIDLFSGSALTLTYIALFFSSILGALFGHVVAGIFATDVAIRRVYGKREFAGYNSLSEHRVLKLQIHAEHIAVHVYPAPLTCTLHVSQDPVQHTQALRL